MYEGGDANSIAKDNITFQTTLSTFSISGDMYKCLENFCSSA